MSKELGKAIEEWMVNYKKDSNSQQRFWRPTCEHQKEHTFIFFLLAIKTWHIMKNNKEEFNMSYFDMLRFQGFVAGAVAEGCLVLIVSVIIILVKAAKNRRTRWY